MASRDVFEITDGVLYAREIAANAPDLPIPETTWDHLFLTQPAETVQQYREIRDLATIVKRESSADDVGQISFLFVSEFCNCLSFYYYTYR